MCRGDNGININKNNQSNNVNIWVSTWRPGESQSNSVNCAEDNTEVRWGFVVNGLFQGEHHQDRRQSGSTHTLRPTGPGMSAGPPALSPWEGLPFPSQHTIILPASLAARSGQVTTLQPVGCELSDKHHFQEWPIVAFHGQFYLYPKLNEKISRM